MSNKKPYFLGNLLSKNKQAIVKPFDNRILVLEEILKELKAEQKKTGDTLWRNIAGYKELYKIIKGLISESNNKSN